MALTPSWVHWSHNLTSRWQIWLNRLGDPYFEKHAWAWKVDSESLSLANDDRWAIATSPYSRNLENRFKGSSFTRDITNVWWTLFCWAQDNEKSTLLFCNYLLLCQPGKVLPWQEPSGGNAGLNPNIFTYSYLLLWKTFFAVPFGCYWSGFPPSESAVAFSVSIKHFTRRISRITCTLRNNNHARQAYYLFHDLGLLKLPWNDGPSCMGTKKLSNWRLNAEFEKEIFDCDQCNFRDRFAAWWNEWLPHVPQINKYITWKHKHAPKSGSGQTSDIGHHQQLSVTTLIDLPVIDVRPCSLTVLHTHCACLYWVSIGVQEPDSICEHILTSHKW